MRKEKEKKIDGTLLVTVWILLGLGLVILYSASAYNGRVRFHDPAYYFKKQLFASALGVIGMYAVAKIDYRRLFALAPWFYAASLALSTAVLFFGSEYNGSKRWLKLGPLSFQPSERSEEHTSALGICQDGGDSLPALGDGAHERPVRQSLVYDKGGAVHPADCSACRKQ